MYRIGDFLIQIKNAYQAHHKQVTYSYSNVTEALGKILEKEGYIGKLKVSVIDGSVPERKIITIDLKYNGRTPVLTNIKLVSKPSVHHYVGKGKLSRVSKHGIGIVTTNQGMMTVKDAKKKGIGGEIICLIS